MISVHDATAFDVVGRLASFRRELHRCLTARADALFELADALLCVDAPVRSLVELSLVGEHRRGHGSLYAALNRSRVDVDPAADRSGRGVGAPGPRTDGSSWRWM